MESLLILLYAKIPKKNAVKASQHNLSQALFLHNRRERQELLIINKS